MKKSERYLSTNLVIIFALLFFLILIFPNQIKDVLVEIGPKSQQSLAIVVPHFDFAKKDREEFLNKLPDKIRPDTIIIASTNHFNTGSKSIITSDSDWSVNDQKIVSESQIYKNLIDSEVAENNQNLLISDHGIKNVINDMAQVFKDSKYLSLLINDKTSAQELEQLQDQINQGCENQNCLFVASVDFSHYGPNSLAQNHDQTSLSALSDLNTEKIKDLENDSANVIQLLISFAKSKNLNRFNLFNNSNSGEEGQDDQIETTSWIIGEYDKGPKIEDKSTTLTFAGDMMFGRMVYHNFKDVGLTHVFDKLGNRVFWGSDISVANLEGPVSKTEVPDDFAATDLKFNFQPQSIDALKFLKLSAVSLANNHTLNAESSGLDDTRELLAQKNIFDFGQPYGISDISLERFNTDFPVSIIGINALAGVNQNQLDSIIKAEKASNRYVVIFPHWGSEYLKTHSNSQESLAHHMIDIGVDLIVGSHPHVVEDSEIYNGKLIVYSLGNFVFDQTFSDATQQGFVLAVIIKNSGVTASFLPIEIKNYQPQFAKDEVRAKILDNSLPKDGYIEKVRSDTIKLK